MKRVLYIFLVLLQSLVVRGHDAYKRNTSIDITHYEFSVAVSDSSDIIYGHASVYLRFINPVSHLQLDLENSRDGKGGMTVSSVTFNKGGVKWVHESDRIVITLDNPAPAGSDGILNINYSGIPPDGLIISKNKFGDRTFFADNWPDRAHNWLPCIDHPYDKATVDFIITAPDHYEVVANGILAELSCLPHHTRLTHWREEVPVATKVMAVGIAPFATKYEGNVHGIPDWTWVFFQNREEGFSDYSVAMKPLKFYSELIGRYPFEKLANVQSKTIFGGLENAGCIFYAESSVTGQGKAESLMAHEIAHQWFGNSVTENDWHHIWLSEGFATYLTAAYLEKTYGKTSLDETMKTARDRVVRYSIQNPSPVVDTTVTDLMKLLNPNSYQKGAWFLHMLRHELGDEIFWQGIRTFYDKFCGSNAMTPDFEKIMEKVSNKDLSTFFRQWLYTPGQPELSIRISPAVGKRPAEIIIEQKQAVLFSFSLAVRIRDENGTRILNIPVNDRVTRQTINSKTVTELTPDPDTNLLFRLD